MTPTPEILRKLLVGMDPAWAAMKPEEFDALIERATQADTNVRPADDEPPAQSKIEDRKSTIPESRTPNPEPSSRWQDALIEGEIVANSSVLDLGCGDGQLLSRLMTHKRVRGQGVELDPESVFQCVERGVSVLQSDLDAGLKGFADQSFDYVILEETLQTLHRPADVLGEMLRVGRTGIVSFPNFGYWRVRLELAMRGQMPRTEILPYRWYDTPNIHLLTLRDFLDWAQADHVSIVRGHSLTNGDIHPLVDTDTLQAAEVLLIVQRVQ